MTRSLSSRDRNHRKAGQSGGWRRRSGEPSVGARRWRASVTWNRRIRMVLGHHRKQRMGGLRCMLLQLLVLDVRIFGETRHGVVHGRWRRRRNQRRGDFFTERMKSAGNKWIRLVKSLLNPKEKNQKITTQKFNQVPPGGLSKQIVIICIEIYKEQLTIGFSGP